MSKFFLPFSITYKIILAAGFLLPALACSKKEIKPIPPSTKDTVFIAGHPASGLPVSSRFCLMDTSWLKDDHLKELSGLIKNYDDIFYWVRNSGETIAHCLQRQPERLDYVREYQGESIAWTKSGKSYYTISEKVGSHIPVLYHYVSH